MSQLSRAELADLNLNNNHHHQQHHDHHLLAVCCFRFSILVLASSSSSSSPYRCLRKVFSTANASKRAQKTARRAEEKTSRNGTGSQSVCGGHMCHTGHLSQPWADLQRVDSPVARPSSSYNNSLTNKPQWRRPQRSSADKISPQTWPAQSSPQRVEAPG